MKKLLILGGSGFIGDSIVNYGINKKLIKHKINEIYIISRSKIYKKNNRTDLLEIEKGEVEIISTFLPKQLNETETTKVCKETIQSIKAQGPKDIGKVMGVLKKKYSDILDFAKAGEQVKEILK